MKKKVQTICYKCNKCNKTVYFQSNMEYSTNCKTCGNKMQFLYENEYNPKNGLNAIKNSNTKNTDFDRQKLTIECPYCHSTNTTKITTTSKVVHTALFGIFSLSRNSKQWHCNECSSDF